MRSPTCFLIQFFAFNLPLSLCYGDTEEWMGMSTGLKPGTWLLNIAGAQNILSLSHLFYVFTPYTRAYSWEWSPSFTQTSLDRST